MIRLRTAFVACLLASRAARGADWVVTPSDFRPMSVDVVGLSAEGVKYKSSDSADVKTLPLEKLIDVRRSGGPQNPPAAKFVLRLVNGDRLAGEPASAVGETLTWTEPSVGPVAVPFKSLASLERSFAPPPRKEPPKQDVVTLNNGDTVAGIFTDVAEGSMKLQGDNGPLSLPLNNVKRAVFAVTGSSAATARGLRFSLSDGSKLTATSATIEGMTVKLTMPDARPIVCRLGDVSGIEQVNGPVNWLSSHAPIESEQRSYIADALPWPARFDAAVDGSPLAFDGRPFEHGIGVHAYSKLVFAVDPQWKAFRTQFAISSDRESPRSLADVTVRIKVDDKTVFEQPHVRAGVLSPVQVVDLDGAKTLTLECDFGPDPDVQPHLNWLDPALLREKAATPVKPNDQEPRPNQDPMTKPQ